MKIISIINATFTEIQECSIAKVGLSLDHSVSLCFILLPVLRTLEAMFQAKNNVGSTTTSIALA